MGANSNVLVRIIVFCLLGILLMPFLLLLEAIQMLSRKIFTRSFCKSVAGEIAVVTGGAHGLGREISFELAREGCHIAVVDINFKGAEETAKMITQKYKVKAKAYEVDVADFEQVKQLNETITKDLGTATILVNNAGIVTLSKPKNPDFREIQRMVSVNFTSHFWTNFVFLPKMKELGKGHIVAICSASSMIPLMYNSPYSSSKSAVRTLMNVLRLELRYENHKNIKTTTVYPYFLQTNESVNEIAEAIGVTSLIESISGQTAAIRVVRGILQNEVNIAMPHSVILLYMILQLLPARWADVGVLTACAPMWTKYENLLMRQSKM